MTDNGLQLLVNTGLNNLQNTYTLAIAPGYRIIGYDPEFANDVATTSMTVTPAEGAEAVTAEGSASYTLKVRNLLKKSTTFDIAALLILIP